MSIANTVLDSIRISKQASADMIEFYYREGVISSKELELYTARLLEANNELSYKMTSIFGVCEARLQVKREKGKE